MRIQIKIVAMAILTIAFALGAAVMPAMAGDVEDTGTAAGTFGMNNVAPTVTSVALYQSDNSTTATHMDPTLTYVVKIDVQDTNTMDDLRNITVVINRSAYVGNNDVQKQANFSWTSTGSGTGTWALNGPTGTTWSLEASSTAQSATESTGTWYLYFKPAKTAEEGSWGINVTAKDQVVWSAKADQTGRTMNFYSQISSVIGNLEFSTVALGSTTPLTPSATVIANGNYKLQSYSSSPWTGGGYEVAVVDVAPGANEIQLRNNEADAVGSADAVGTGSYTPITGYTSKTITAEAGQVSPVFVWLTLPSVGIHAASYEGTYYYQIANA